MLVFVLPDSALTDPDAFSAYLDACGSGDIKPEPLYLTPPSGDTDADA